MTSSEQLKNKLKNLDSFIDVVPCDRIPQLNKFPASLIINTDKHDEKGEHWVAIYISNRNIGYYFDSYGLPPLNREIEVFLNQYTNGWKYNSQTIQGLNSTKCGQFSVLFILLKTIGFTFQQITNLFTNDFYKNDIIVQKIFDVL